MSSRSDAVTKSRRAAQGAGRVRLSSMLSDEGSDLYRKVRSRFASERALIEAGLRALEGRGEISRAALLAEIERRLT